MASRRSARISALAETKPVDTLSPTPPPPAPAARPRKRKASPAVETDPAPPTTPKRRAPKSAATLPSTPTATPSAVRLIAEPAAAPNGFQTPTSSAATTTTATTPKPKSRAVARLADPNLTNAPLLSPETSRVVSRLLGPDVPAEHPTITTANILEDACAHLIKVNPRLNPLIEAHHCRIFSAEGLAEKIDPFESLASGIISQQVSGAAAKAIKARFIGLFSYDQHADDTTPPRRKFPTPSQVAATSIETLRGAGLSQRKAEYIQGLSAKFAAGDLTAQWLADAPYEDVLDRLIAVRGLGRWSVEMFACFGLKRMDVFSTGDLGVQRGMAAFAGRDVSKLKAKGGGNKWKYMSEAEMVEMAAPFSPYRSVFMWYMWRVEETEISTLE
ncbi:DNA-3-methyladenine glycosylase [Cytospora mali]|uniref:DNA-3-methyladenine glycosylase n=1 Tax=Cytospora mali TaxID=578113 RepID=A0A194VBB3_CYTMA|nr:DNA-3-methyladenine glycosylase [Valsa mali var. pyri (nom. inval.)]